ncbi:hypothetical protein D3C78_648620 [compost metagenome]
MHVQGVEHDGATVNGTDGGFVFQQNIAVIGFTNIIQRECITLICVGRFTERNNFSIRNGTNNFNTVVPFLIAVSVENMHTTVP